MQESEKRYLEQFPTHFTVILKNEDFCKNYNSLNKPFYTPHTIEHHKDVSHKGSIKITETTIHDGIPAIAVSGLEIISYDVIKLFDSIRIIFPQYYFHNLLVNGNTKPLFEYNMTQHILTVSTIESVLYIDKVFEFGSEYEYDLEIQNFDHDKFKNILIKRIKRMKEIYDEIVHETPRQTIVGFNELQ